MAVQSSTRRNFLWSASVMAMADDILAQTTSASATGLPQRPLGRSGEKVSIACLGGWHIGSVPDAEAIRIMHAAIDEGMTFFDNAWDYHNGHAEELMGKALAMDNRRKKVFLMTKNCERDYEGSMRHLEDSLRRLKTDYLDLWQFHEMVYDDAPDMVFERGGIKAAIEARKQGKVRFIGFTGHKDPRIHLKMLAKPFDWDTSQMPSNVMDAHYRSFQREVMPVCMKKKVGVIGMKGLGGGGKQGRLIEKLGLTAEECYRYCLSLPLTSQVMGITSMEQLKADINLARNFKPMTPQEMEAFRAKVKAQAVSGQHELFKSSQMYDGPYHRKQHGFDV